MPVTDPHRRPAANSAVPASNRPARGADSAGIIVEKLTTVVKNRAGEELYLGWGPDGNAAVTRDRGAISEAGLDVLRVYERARNLYVPVVPFAELVPVEYGYAKLQDMAVPAEDFFIVTTKSADGQPVSYRIGELALLDGIVNARSFFQDTSIAGQMGQRVVPSEAIYAVIAPSFEYDEKRTGLAMLFKPALAGAPQEATFRYFLVSILRMLWQNDQKDGPEGRKGYYDVVQGHLAPPRRRAPLLLRLMFVDEETARAKWERLWRLLFRSPSASTSSVVDDLDELGMSQLFDLATGMRDAARRYLDRHAIANRPFRFDRR